MVKISISPVGSFGYWIDKREEVPELRKLDLTSIHDIETLKEFEKSVEGLRIVCADYLADAKAVLAEKGLSPWGTEMGHDLHSFMLITDGKYRDRFLHLQVYPQSVKDRSVLVSAYIKEEPKDNTSNVGPSWQKQLSFDDGYKELTSSVEDLLK